MIHLRWPSEDAVPLTLNIRFLALFHIFTKPASGTIDILGADMGKEQASWSQLVWTAIG